jgi:hypothetical protein
MKWKEMLMAYLKKLSQRFPKKTIRFGIETEPSLSDYYPTATSDQILPSWSNNPISPSNVYSKASKITMQRSVFRDKVQFSFICLSLNLNTLYGTGFEKNDKVILRKQPLGQRHECLM